MKTTRTVVAMGLLFITSVLTADTLRLRNGSQVPGTFLGGDTRQVRFLGSDGNTGTYNVSEVASIDFSVGETSAAVAPTPAPTPAPPPPVAAAPSAAAATIPAGTLITIRMIDSIDTDVTGAGERFRASIDDPVVVNGQTIVARGADATVQVMRVEQAGRISGSDEVAMKLYDITIGGRTYEASTEYAEIKGEGQGRQTAKTTAVTTGVGAVIGGIFGGGRGAAIGAGAGAATGVAVSATRGKTLRIPSETRLEFALRAPLPVN